jgi:hypothetical protein
VERALTELHDRLHADLLPILRDELRDVGPGGEGRDDRQLEHDPLARRQKPRAVGVALGEPELVEELVGLLGLVLRVLPGVLLAREVGMSRRRHALARLAQAEEDRLFDLIAVDRLGQRDPEFLRGHELADLGVGLVGLVELDDRVGAAEGGHVITRYFPVFSFSLKTG